MTILDGEYLEFWIIVVCAVLVLIIYQVQAVGWPFTRWFILLLNLVAGGWSVIGLTSPIHVLNTQHVVFFAAVDLVFLVELIGVSVIARRELKRRQRARHQAVTVDPSRVDSDPERK